MKENGLREKVVSGMIWRFAERICVQLLSFIISLILARMLAPELYGTVSLVLVFINLANVLVNNGLGEACVQQKDSGEKEFSTVFYCSVVFATLLYLLLFFMAKPIASFYRNSSLCMIIRILSLQIPLSSIKTIQQAYVTKHMLFRKFFFSTLGGTIISGIIGIVMAFRGYGVWALVAQQLINSFIDMMVLFITVPWRPKLIFEFETAKRLIGYGWKITTSSFLSELYTQLRSLVIGRKYSTSDLAYYNKGDQFSSLAISNLNTAISSVLFPAMSSVNDDAARLKQITRKSIQVSSYVIFPVMFGIFSVADSLIKILLTDIWLPCVPYLRLCCIYWMFQPIQTANIQAIKAIGRSDICLKLEVIKKIVGFMILFFSMRYGVFIIVFSNTLYAFISTVINIIPNKKLISYGYREQLVDIFPSLALSIIMTVIVMSLHKLGWNTYIELCVQIIVGVLVYIGGSIITRNQSFNYVMVIVKNKIVG